MDSGTLEAVAVSLTEDQIASEANDSPSPDSQGKDGEVNEPVVFAAKSHKRMASKESPRTSLNSLNKFKSQIKKPSHRNGSPLNWIPRQKGDTYLNRKIKRLQEASGMNSTLDETLGTANPHYCRLLREKIAAKQAAIKAMEARKAAMVEASWCRILKAARIQSKEAEALLSRTEKSASEATEAAAAKGVMMYDTVDCAQKHYVVETSLAKGKASTHTVKATAETAFEVDRQVAAAVKTAFVRLAADCPSSLNKDEYIGLLRKISEKPDADETNQESSDFTTECEYDSGSEFELGSEDASFLRDEALGEETMFGIFGRRHSPQKYDKAALVDIMFQRIKCLKEEELASLATIVATCGLNAVLAEMGNQQQDRSSSYTNCNSRRTSTFGGRSFRKSGVELGTSGVGGKQPSDVELPSLDKCLIKHTTKLEREVQEARNARKNDSKGGQENPVKTNFTGVASSEVKHEEGLGSILVKHSSKLEREKADLKRKLGQMWEQDTKEHGEGQQKGKGSRVKQKVEDVPSLDKVLVKHVSRLEREVQEAKSRRSNGSAPDLGSIHNVSEKAPSASQVEENLSSPCSTAECTEKENIDSNNNKANVDEIGGGLEINVQKDTTAECTEKENIDSNKNKANVDETGGGLEINVQKDATAARVLDVAQQDMGKGEGGLDSILVKHKSKLEREKMAAAQQYDQAKLSVSRQEAREKELQLAWGGMNLGHCTRPHMSRLEREKAAWIKDEEQRKAAMCVNSALP